MLTINDEQQNSHLKPIFQALEEDLEESEKAMRGSKE